MRRARLPGVQCAAVRWWWIQSVAGKPGAPASRVVAEDDGDGATLSIAFRAAGRGDFAIGRPRPLSRADFDAVWTLLDRGHADPLPLPHRILDASTVTIAIGGSGRDRDARTWSWTSPSTADIAFAGVLAVAIDLARRVGRAELRYFPASR
jgi:hypothetical protein